MYGRIRHPLMAGFVVIFWSAPVMTAGHLLLRPRDRLVLAGIAFEEHDRSQPGGTYAAYRGRVPALILGPRPGVIRRGLSGARKRQEAVDMTNRTVIHPGGGTSESRKPRGYLRPGRHGRAVRAGRHMTAVAGLAKAGA